MFIFVSKSVCMCGGGGYCIVNSNVFLFRKLGTVGSFVLLLTLAYSQNYLRSFWPLRIIGCIINLYGCKIQLFSRHWFISLGLDTFIEGSKCIKFAHLLRSLALHWEQGVIQERETPLLEYDFGKILIRSAKIWNLLLYRNINL